MLGLREFFNGKECAKRVSGKQRKGGCGHYNGIEAIQMYGESERYDEKIETAARMIADGDLSVEKIAQYCGSFHS